MKVLVTGATGFVGQYLIPKLKERNYDVVCLVRPSSDISELKKYNVEFYRGDVTKKDTLSGISKGIDYVIHMAARGVVEATSEEDYLKFLNMNVKGTKNLLEEFMDSSRLKKFIHFSSTAAMGFINKPILNETDDPSPHTPYQKSKRKSELIVLEAFKEKQMPTVILRPCMIYGIGGKKGEYLKFCRLMKKGLFPKVGFGDNMTPMVYVSDVADAAVLALENSIPGEVYIVSGATSVRLDDFHREVMKNIGKGGGYPFVPKSMALFGAKCIEKLCDLFGKTPVVTYRNMKSTVTDRTFDISKAENQLGYHPKVDMITGAKLTIKWYKDEGLL